MSEENKLRHDLQDLVNDLRHTLQEIGQDSLPQAQVVSNTRDRLHYIANLTEQAASQTLNAAEVIGDRLRAQLAEANSLAALDGPAQVQDFLQRVQVEHAASAKDLAEVIQAQAFQDLVGQVINKLLTTVEKMEAGLAHLLIEEESDAGMLSGPQVRKESQVSQDDIDSLFD